MLELLKRLSKFDAVIERLGGSVAVGRLIGKNSSYVSNWRRERAVIPPKYYVIIRSALKKKGYVPSDRVFGFVWPKDCRKK